MILAYKGQRFRFTVDQDPPLRFWRIESSSHKWLSPMRVRGGETPAFFRRLADEALTHGFDRK